MAVNLQCIWKKQPIGMILMIISQWLFKTFYEILATPITYLLINKLKKSH